MASKIELKMEYNQDYYIHLRKKNIGKAYNGAGENSSLYDVFNNYKETFSDYAKEDYFKNMQGKISSSNFLIKKLFDAEEEFTEFDRQIKEAVQKGINVDLLKEMHRKGQNINFEIMASPKSNGKNARIYLKEYNDLIAYYRNILNMMKEYAGSAELIAALDMIIKNNNSYGNRQIISSKKLGVILKNELKKIEGSAIDMQVVNTIFDKLKVLEHALSSGGMKSNKDEALKSMRTITSNLMVGEGFAENALNIIKIMALNATQEAVTSIGSASGQDYITRNRYNYDEKKIESSTFKKKPDVSHRDARLIVENILGKKKSSIKMQLDLSSKFYLTEEFLGSGALSASKKSVKIKSGGIYSTLGNLIRETFNSDLERYLAFNTFTFSPKSKEALKIQDLILTKNINRFFSGDSSDNFASYIIINGNVISAWQLLKMATNTNIGRPSSAMSKNQHIALDIEDRGEFQKANRKVNKKGGRGLAGALIRSRRVNSKINSAKVQAVLNASYMRNAKI